MVSTRSGRRAGLRLATALVIGGLATASLPPDRSGALASQPEASSIPVPVPRPSVEEAGIADTENRTLRHSALASDGLARALEALASGNPAPALKLRSTLVAGSYESRLLDWLLASTPDSGLGANDLARIAGSSAGYWPGLATIAENAERTLLKEYPDNARLESFFSGHRPVTLDGAAHLAAALVERGEPEKAREVLAPLWRTERLSAAYQNTILKLAGAALGREDHCQRMFHLLNNDRLNEAARIAGYCEKQKLAAAWTALVRGRGNLAQLLEEAEAEDSAAPALTYLAISGERRAGNYDKAATLIEAIEVIDTSQVDGDNWWTELRIVSREMLERGEAERAYGLVRRHRSQSDKTIADAEFHAGWYALRFLDQAGEARQHFTRLVEIATTPITLARAHYWLGRTLEAQGSDKSLTMRHYLAAAGHPSTFYGQLAAAKAGLAIHSFREPRPDEGDTIRLGENPLVRAIAILEAFGLEDRATGLKLQLARSLQSPGEMALAADMVRQAGNPSLALRMSRIAHLRGLDVDALAWPVGYIPEEAAIDEAGRALAHAIARQESGFNPAAVSSANARGLLQLLPATARQVAKREGLPWSYTRLTSDAAYNATLGAAYLHGQLERFSQSYILTFAAYNAGPSRVNEWLKRFGDPRGSQINEVVDWIELIPFPETRNYVQRVMENYQVYKLRLGGGTTSIVSDLSRGRIVASSRKYPYPFGNVFNP